ncbi:hypothetical protein SAMN02800691_2105 [Luteibacter sp. UNCMF366Tsu5.1]|nr:hypothetical protein SAMN02800691_2105 [Luteibacter sp. UNCMF366Tsu5.1]
MDLFDDFVEPAMEGLGAAGSQGGAPAAGPAEPDPNWYPV